MVKVNSIILPGINEDHIEAVAQRMADLGVDLFNAMPYYPNAGSDFEAPGRTGKENGRGDPGCIRRTCQADAPLYPLSGRCRRPAGGSP
jgi:MoaA/NifB/PqqE/SkfB family radical SAM enzyme